MMGAAGLGILAHQEETLPEETTMSLKWIAQRLQMGSWTYVPNLLREKAPN